MKHNGLKKEDEKLGRCGNSIWEDLGDQDKNVKSTIIRNV